MSKNNVDIVAATYECGKNGDFVGFVKDFSEDCSWTEMKGSPYTGTYIGADEIVKNVFTPMNNEWAPFACAPEEFLDCGDSVVMIGRYFGKNIATDKPFDVRVVHRWIVKDGKICSFEQFTDTKLIEEAMK